MNTSAAPADTTHRQPALLWAPDSRLHRVLASWQEKNTTAALLHSSTDPGEAKKFLKWRRCGCVARCDRLRRRGRQLPDAAFACPVTGLKRSRSRSGLEFVWYFFAATLLTFPWATTPDDALYSSDSPEVINSWLRGIMRHEHAFVLVTLERLTNLSNWVLVNTIVPTLFQCQFAHVCWWVLAQYLWVFAAAVGRYYDNLFIWELFGSRRRCFESTASDRGMVLIINASKNWRGKNNVVWKSHVILKSCFQLLSVVLAVRFQWRPGLNIHALIVFLHFTIGWWISLSISPLKM